jgi:hypothetical protein
VLRSTANNTLPSAEILFVSWARHARVTAVAKDIGAKVVIPTPWALKWPWPLRYLVQAVSTIVVVTAQRPRGVIFTNPPFLTGSVLLMVRRVLHFSLWADCHSGAFNDPRWSRFARPNASMLGRCDGVVFHNSAQANQFGALCRQYVVVWGWQMIDRRLTAVTNEHADASYGKGPGILAPLTYTFDEPVAELLVAAERCPDLKLTLTGSAPAGVRQDAPDNVSFSGWVSDDEYHKLLDACDAVLCLTTRSATMQTTLIEAIEYGKPVVVSDTAVLREWRGDDENAFFVASHSQDDLSTAMRAAVVARPTVIAEERRQAIIARSAVDIAQLRNVVLGR